MASKRRLRRKSCDNKKRHGTEPEAKFAIVKMRDASPGLELEAYKCRHCGGWHVGHAPRAKTTYKYNMRKG